MKCSHCRVDFHDDWNVQFVRWPDDKSNATDPDGKWTLRTTKCPACTRLTIVLRVGSEGSPHDIQAWPKTMSRPPLPVDVTIGYRKDYEQAARVLTDSPEASAALSRRCLQRLLREKAEVKPGKLHKEIQAAVDSGRLPTYVTDTLLHAIRHFGNFGAHAETDVNTNEIIEVEPGEAEWCLDILDTLFDFYFVQPAKTAARLKQLEEKLDRKA
jgi:Domain of unknown function (DUF4145)